MLTPLFEIVALQVVDNCQVVDISTAARDIATLVASVLGAELLYQLLYKPQTKENHR